MFFIHPPFLATPQQVLAQPFFLFIPRLLAEWAVLNFGVETTASCDQLQLGILNSFHVFSTISTDTATTRIFKFKI
jgi:hypothetical protein